MEFITITKFVAHPDEVNIYKKVKFLHRESWSNITHIHPEGDDYTESGEEVIACIESAK